MPVYEVTAPDGRKYRVTAPDGATQADAIAYVRNQTPAAPAHSAAEAGADATAAEYGPLQAGIVSAGRTLDRLYQGGKQMALQVPAAFGSTSARSALDEQAKEEAQKTAAFAALEKRNPVATTVGGAAPLLAAPILGAGAVGMAGSAALPGLMEYGDPSERFQRGALGAAGGLAGAGIAKGLERFLKPVQTVPDAARWGSRPARARYRRSSSNWPRIRLAVRQRSGWAMPIRQRLTARRHGRWARQLRALLMMC
jgi:hypothetical protein